MPKFWMDSDALIRAKDNGYAFDLVPDFWDRLLSLAGDGDLCSPIRVHSELKDGSDELAEWVKKHREALFIEPSEDVQKKYREVADFVEATYAPDKAKEFLAGADAWLIAHACEEGGQIVTMETRAKQVQFTSKARIPDVSRHFGVSCINVWEMVRLTGMKVTIS